MAQRDDIAVVAISYDPVATLAGFAKEFGVTYPLLADEGSVEIKRLGLLNDTIVAELIAWSWDVDEENYKVPYPGTFLLDEEGLVVEKKFERSHRLRPSGTLLIHDLMGQQADPVVSGVGAAPGMRAAAWLDQEAYFPGQRLYVHVRLQVDPGLHVYVPPVADGYIPLQITLENVPQLTVESAELPTGEAFQVEGLAQEFLVVDDTVDARVPFYFSDEASENATLMVRVGYQACDESACFAPEELRIELPIKHMPIPMP